MSYGQAGAIIGNVVGSYFGPVGGAIGSAIGGYIGASFDPAIINSGPRLSDLKVQDGSFGTPIAYSFGTSRVAGTVIFLTDIREHKSRENAGKGGQKVYNDTYTYDLDFAIVLTDQHGFPVKGITGVRRIWANGALVRSNAENASLGTLIASSQFCDQITVYPGDYAQLPDPTIEAAKGAGNVSAYRGFAYAVFKGVKVTGQGSPVPQMEFEIVQGGQVSVAKYIFATYQSRLATETSTRGRGWCNRASAFVMTYSNDRGVLYTHYYDAGVDQPEDLALTRYGGGSSDFDRTFVNCNDAPLMADINFITQNATDGMILSLWVMRLDTPHAETTAVTSNLLLLTHAIDVLSFPYYALANENRVAYEIDTTYLAFGSTHGPDRYYGVHMQFGSGTGSTNCDLPANRLMIDLAIYLGILYVWNMNTGVDGNGAHQTYITAFDITGAMLFDKPHIAESWSNQGYTWASLCVNEHGTFTWHAGTSQTQVNRFTPAGPVLLCSDANTVNANGTGDGEVIPRDQTNRTAFWTDGSIANIGMSYNAAVQPYQHHFWTVQFKAITKGSVDLSYALGVLSGLAGLTPDEVDVSAQTQTLRGYSFKQTGTATSFIEPLCTAFYVEAFESEGKLKYRTLGGPTVADIPYEELGFTGGEPGDAEVFPLARVQEKDLPRSLSVVYANWDADFQIGSEAPARRLTTSSVNDVVIQTPVTSTAGEAAKRQDVLLYKAWLERDQRAASLSRKYSSLEPSDPVNIEWPKGKWTRYRVKHLDYQGTFSNYEFVRDEPSVLISSARSTTLQRGQVSIPLPSPTAAEFLDVPIFSDAYDDPGFYIAMGGRNDDWHGALAERSVDNGVTFGPVGTVSSSATIGTCTTALPDHPGVQPFDNISTVRVVMRTNDTPLASATVDQLLADETRNAAVIGNEILQFQTATLVAANTYDLSGFLRGMRGTEAQMPLHVVNDRFVLITLAGIIRVNLGASEIGQTRIYRITSADSDASRTFSFVNQANGLKPFAPTNLGSDVAASGDVTLAWERRTRLHVNQITALALPLGEANESYSVEVSGTANFATIATTIAASTPTAALTAAQITALVAAGMPRHFYWRVYQLSATVGRGFVSAVAEVYA